MADVAKKAPEVDPNAPPHVAVQCGAILMFGRRPGSDPLTETPIERIGEPFPVPANYTSMKLMERNEKLGVKPADQLNSKANTTREARKSRIDALEGVKLEEFSDDEEEDDEPEPEPELETEPDLEDM